MLRVATTDKPDLDRMTAADFPATFSQFKEGSRQINEAKAPEWLDAKVRTKEVDISNDDRPKIAKIGDYWNEQQTAEIVTLLREFQDVFARDYKDLKGLVQEMGEMKIDNKPDVRPVKKRPYKLAHKYKEIVKKEIDNMLEAGIIYPIDQSEWASPMVVQHKKHDPTRLRICVDFRELNKVTLTDPFPTPYADEILNEVAGHECYSFTYGFSGYNQVPIAKEYQEKTTFVCEFGSFAYRVIPFGLKNAPTVFSRIVVKHFQEYIYKTMAVYFDDWTIYSTLKDHYTWLQLMLERC